MTELENRLRRDAAKIRAEPPPELKTRLQASLRAAESAPPRRRRSTLVPGPRLLGGAMLASAVAVAALLALRPEAPAPEDWPATPVAQTSNGSPSSLPLSLHAPLRADAVLLELEQMAVQPLSEEQERLEADLRRLRDELRRAF